MEAKLQREQIDETGPKEYFRCFWLPLFGPYNDLAAQHHKHMYFSCESVLMREENETDVFLLACVASARKRKGITKGARILSLAARDPPLAPEDLARDPNGELARRLFSFRQTPFY